MRDFLKIYFKDSWSKLFFTYWHSNTKSGKNKIARWQQHIYYSSANQRTLCTKYLFLLLLVTGASRKSKDENAESTVGWTFLNEFMFHVKKKGKLLTFLGRSAGMPRSWLCYHQKHRAGEKQPGTRGKRSA